MKFNVSPARLITRDPPDISDILGRVDLSVNEKIYQAYAEHGLVVLDLFKSLGMHYEKSYEDEDEDDYMNSDDNEEDDEDKGKVLGDGVVKRPPQASLEGEPEFKMARTAPQGEEPPHELSQEAQNSNSPPLYVPQFSQFITTFLGAIDFS